MLAFKRFACYEIYWSGKKVNRYIILLASQILAIAKKKIFFAIHIFASEARLSDHIPPKNAKLYAQWVQK